MSDFTSTLSDIEDQTTAVATANALGSFSDFDIIDEVRPENIYGLVGLYYLELFGHFYASEIRKKAVDGTTAMTDDEAEAAALRARRVIADFSQKAYTAFFPTEAEVILRSNVWMDADWPIDSTDDRQNMLECLLKAFKFILGPAYFNYANFQSMVLQPVISPLYTILQNNFTVENTTTRLEDGVTTSDEVLITWATNNFTPVGEFDFYKFPQVTEYPDSGLESYLRYVVPAYSELSGTTLYRNQLVRNSATIYIVTKPHTASGATPASTKARTLFSS